MSPRLYTVRAVADPGIQRTGAPGAEARRFGRSAGLLSAGVGTAGLLTYLFFALASHNLEADQY